MLQVLIGISIPFFGTILGAGFVFFLRGVINVKLQRAFLGFAAGVMVAASVWSLIIPAMEHTNDMGRWAFLPVVVGIWFGFLGLMFLDDKIPVFAFKNEESQEEEIKEEMLEEKCKYKKITMLIVAVTLHNLPEGIAVGAVFAGLYQEYEQITFPMAMVMSVGIAMQNIPEGAIISLPLHGRGMEKRKAFLYGVLSGVIEPVGAAVTILLSGFMLPLLPYCLSFAAGAMLYVVVEELIPEMKEGEKSFIGTVFFAVGFTVMMVLDVVAG